MKNLKEIIKESFIQYSGAVLQSRADFIMNNIDFSQIKE